MIKEYYKTKKIADRKHCVSVSTRLLNDIQELWLKVGISTTIQSNKIRLESRGGFSVLNKQHVQKVPFNDFVYCVSMPNSYIVVRRNGKIYVTGNCMNFRGVKAINSSTVTQQIKGNIDKIELANLLQEGR